MNKIVVLLSAVATLASVSANGAALAADKVKIGLIATLSGPVSLLGQEQKRAVEIALDHLAGKLGGLPVELITVDTKGNPSLAVQEAAKLIERDKVDFLTGVSLSNETLALIKPITESKTFLIGTAGGPAPLAGKDCNPFYFNVTTQNEMLSEPLGTHVSARNVKSVYLIAMDYQWGWDQVAGFKRNFKGQIVGEKLTPLAQMDFSAELAQIRAAKPDAIVAFYAGAPGITFVKQYAQAGLKDSTPFFGHVATFDSFTFQAIGEAALGAEAINFVSTEWDTPQNKKLVDAYREKFGRAPSALVFYQYDAMFLIDSAVRAVNGDLSNKDAVRAALRKAEFPSVRPTFRFNVNHMPIQDAYAFRVERRSSGEMYLKSVGLVVKEAGDSLASQCAMK